VVNQSWQIKSRSRGPLREGSPELWLHEDEVTHISKPFLVSLISSG
jgi:hypothetical protein